MSQGPQSLVAKVAGRLPSGMHPQTCSDPREVNNTMAGTPTTAGAFTWTTRVTDYHGQQATQLSHPPA